MFEEYRAQLASRKLKEVDDAYRDAAALLSTQHGADAAGNAYSAIVVDETQDLGPQALRLLRAMIPAGANDLFFVGDGHQRIYNRNRAAMSRCGIQIRGRSRKLYLNYRTTEEIRRQAVSLLEGCDIDDLDDGHDENRRYKSLSHGAAPLVVTEPTLEAALARSLGLVGEWVAGGPQPTTTCVVAATRAIRDNAEKVFRSGGMSTHVIEANRKDTSDTSVVRFSTMHRAKGLVLMFGRSDHPTVVPRLPEGKETGFLLEWLSACVPSKSMKDRFSRSGKINLLLWPQINKLRSTEQRDLLIY